ncbi:hypothetical protein SDC9_190815 [bioreactor metagenome]|uniref:Uncharacterized protein n=1 Tax=bioreactor metagenome TaxID=1076179 RepID=A0A645HXC6_9ZZZZ
MQFQPGTVLLRLCDALLALHDALFDDEERNRVALSGREDHFTLCKIAQCQFSGHPQQVFTGHLVKRRKLAQVLNGRLNQ